MKKYISKILQFFIFGGLAGFMFSCNDEFTDYRNPSTDIDKGYSFNEDGSLNVNVSFEVPGMSTAATRAMGYTPNYSDLKLYVLVIDKSNEVIIQRSVATQHDMVISPDHTYPIVNFTINLYPTDNPVALHLIASDQEDLDYQLTQIGRSGLLRTIYTNYDDSGKGHEAYWARINLNKNILAATDNEDPEDEANKRAAEITKMLQHIPMIRNFGRVSAKVEEGLNFKIDQLYLINATDRGAVVPYLINIQDEETRGRNGFVQFFDIQDINGKEKIVPRSYEHMTNTIHYIGEPTTQTGILERDLKSEEDGDEGNKRHSIYFYEQTYRPDSRTYAVIKGHRTTGNNQNPMFYKIDLGKKDPESPYGAFKYYNLIRNFDYVINIKGVDADGYSSLEDAKIGNVFNNLTASVETESLLSISESGESIIVNMTRYVYTEDRKDNEVDIWGQYLVRSGNTSVYESQDLKILIEDPENGEGFLEFGTNDENGITTNNTHHWNIKLKSDVNFTNTVKQQTVVVYRGPKGDDFGLYRKILFTLIDHFNIEKIDTYPGLWENFEDAPWEWPEDDQNGMGMISREVGQSANSPLTLFFKLQEGLPESIFPLQFTIESNRQNITNAPVGNAVVNNVPGNQSLFAGVTTTRVQYVKEVSLDEYRESNIVRVRFLTITDLDQDGIGTDSGNESASETTIRVYNEYFNMAEDMFTRSTATSDPTPAVCDFSQDSWNSFLSFLNTTRTQQNRLTTSSNISNPGNLQFEEQTANQITSGTVDIESPGEEDDLIITTYSYIIMNNVNNYLQYSFTHSNKNERTVRVEVMSTDNSFNPVVPAVSCQGLTFNLVQTIKDSTPYTTYVYEAKTPTNQRSTTYNVQVRPTEAGQCFFKVNIYPRLETESD